MHVMLHVSLYLTVCQKMLRFRDLGLVEEWTSWALGWAKNVKSVFMRESYTSEKNTHPATNKVKPGFPFVMFAHGWSFLGNFL